MGERRGTKGLELWCRRMTEGYPGVVVNNMTTAWRDGLAFCAIIHHFRPDLIDFDKLNKDDIYYNNDLAFQIAEQHLGIPALLEPEDMVEFPVPDRLSILTYLSQFYQTFVVAQGSPSRIVPKRPANASDSRASDGRGVVSPASTSPTSKMPRPSGGRSRREPCAKCGLPVFIAERLNVGKQLYHRTCFRCARCNSQLTLANYYETETENQFCCEICPDEEQIKQISDNVHTNLDEKSVLNRSLSDEEKSAGIKKSDDQDDYSYMFETALEDPYDKGLSKNYTLSTDQSAEFTKARSRFIATQLIDSECDTSEDEAPELPKSEPPELPKSEPPELPKSEPPELPKSEPPDINSFREIDNDIKFVGDSENTQASKESKDLISENNATTSILCSEVRESCDSGFSPQSLDSLVNSNFKVSDVSDKDQPKTAVKQLETNEKILTKENKFLSDNSNSGSSSPSSLVKSRMRLFESKSAGDQSNSNDDLKKCDYVNKDITNKDAEKKFIHKVPLVEDKVDEDRNYLTGLRSKSLVVKESESNNSINNDSSLVDAVDSKDEINHTERKQEDIKMDTSIENSVITISSDSISKIDSSKEDTENSISVKDEIIASPITVTDSSNNSSPVKHKRSTTASDTSPVIEVSDSENKEILQKDKEVYPEDLNPFGDEEEDIEKQQIQSKCIEVQQSLNPFDDEDEHQANKTSPKPAVRKKLKARLSSIVGKNEGTPEYLAHIEILRESYNPFEEDEDDEESKTETSDFNGKSKVVPAPRICLNPFWSDGEEPEDEDEKQRPVPLPRNSRSSAIGTPEPKPRKSGLSISSGLSSATFGSNTSLSSAHSSLGTARKKKQAPKPPTLAVEKQDSAQSSLTSSPSTSVQHSPKATPKLRKAKRAPLPPSITSTPFMANKAPITTSEVSPILANNDKTEPLESLKDKDTVETGDWETEKIIKDELNRNRQSRIITDSENTNNLSVPNKSMYGKWKRRKGPAPSRPIPQRRHIKPLPIVEIRRELEFIEIQQQGLEKQGVRLEQIIREKCEGPAAVTTDVETSLTPDVEDLILQLFELVNEKNELFRKQTELMYLRRQQRLEEEHADLEYQIRCLMMQPEANKTDSDKAREEELISRLLEVVERRNEIVECLEMDRVREAEEDDSINNQLNLYALKREDDYSSKGSLDENNKQKKKSKKEKKFKFKTSKKIDIDKDIDECESSGASLPRGKDKKKKKFNIF